MKNRISPYSGLILVGLTLLLASCAGAPGTLPPTPGPTPPLPAEAPVMHLFWYDLLNNSNLPAEARSSNMIMLRERLNEYAQFLGSGFRYGIIGCYDRDGLPRAASIVAAAKAAGIEVKYLLFTGEPDLGSKTVTQVNALCDTYRAALNKAGFAGNWAAWPDSERLWIDQEVDLAGIERTYKVVSSELVKLAEPTGPTLEELKKTVRQRLANEVNRFIATKPNGGNRYDSTWLLSALDLRAEYREDLTVGGLTPKEETTVKDRLALLKQVQDWIKVVRSYYFAKAKEIRDLTTPAEIQAVTWDLSRFEVGATGPEAYPDPNVNMERVTLPH